MASAPRAGRAVPEAPYAPCESVHPEYGRCHGPTGHGPEHANVGGEWYDLSVTLGNPGEVRVIDPETGGAKGSKLARFDMIPADVLWELAEHYGKGEIKYPSDESGRANWQRGYRWSLSYAALLRHLTAWWSGEAADPETGDSHMTAVQWHSFALRWFERHAAGRDDRPHRLEGTP